MFTSTVRSSAWSFYLEGWRKHWLRGRYIGLFWWSMRWMEVPFTPTTVVHLISLRHTSSVVLSFLYFRDAVPSGWTERIFAKYQVHWSLDFCILNMNRCIYPLWDLVSYHSTYNGQQLECPVLHCGLTGFLDWKWRKARGDSVSPLHCQWGNMVSSIAWWLCIQIGLHIEWTHRIGPHGSFTCFRISLI